MERKCFFDAPAPIDCGDVTAHVAAVPLVTFSKGAEARLNRLIMGATGADACPNDAPLLLVEKGAKCYVEGDDVDHSIAAFHASDAFNNPAIQVSDDAELVVEEDNLAVSSIYIETTQGPTVPEGIILVSDCSKLHCKSKVDITQVKAAPNASINLKISDDSVVFIEGAYTPTSNGTGEDIYCHQSVCHIGGAVVGTLAGRGIYCLGERAWVGIGGAVNYDSPTYAGAFSFIDASQGGNIFFDEYLRLGAMGAGNGIPNDAELVRAIWGSTIVIRGDAANPALLIFHEGAALTNPTVRIAHDSTLLINEETPLAIYVETEQLIPAGQGVVWADEGSTIHVDNGVSLNPTGNSPGSGLVSSEDSIVIIDGDFDVVNTVQTGHALYADNGVIRITGDISGAVLALERFLYAIGERTVVNIEGDISVFSTYVAANPIVEVSSGARVKCESYMKLGANGSEIANDNPLVSVTHNAELVIEGDGAATALDLYHAGAFVHPTISVAHGGELVVAEDGQLAIYIESAQAPAGTDAFILANDLSKIHAWGGVTLNCTGAGAGHDISALDDSEIIFEGSYTVTASGQTGSDIHVSDSRMRIDGVIAAALNGPGITATGMKTFVKIGDDAIYTDGGTLAMPIHSFVKGARGQFGGDITVPSADYGVSSIHLFEDDALVEWEAIVSDGAAVVGVNRNINAGGWGATLRRAAQLIVANGQAGIGPDGGAAGASEIYLGIQGAIAPVVWPAAGVSINDFTAAGAITAGEELVAVHCR